MAELVVRNLVGKKVSLYRGLQNDYLNKSEIIFPCIFVKRNPVIKLILEPITGNRITVFFFGKKTRNACVMRWLCVCVMWCCVWCVVCGWVGGVTRWKTPCVHPQRLLQNVPVCTGNMPTCVNHVHRGWTHGEGRRRRSLPVQLPRRVIACPGG